jgi:hypothetical protein
MAGSLSLVAFLSSIFSFNFSFLGYIQEVMSTIPAFYAKDVPNFTIKEMPPIDSSNMYPSDWYDMSLTNPFC